MWGNPNIITNKWLIAIDMFPLLTLDLFSAYSFLATSTLYTEIQNTEDEVICQNVSVIFLFVFIYS